MAAQMGDNAVDQITAEGAAAQTTDEKFPLTDDEKQAVRAVDRAKLSSVKRQPGDVPAIIDQFHKSLPRTAAAGKAALPGVAINSGVLDKTPVFHVSPTPDERHITEMEGYKDFEAVLAPAVHALSVSNVALKGIDNAHLQLLKDTSKTEDARVLMLAGPAEKAHDRIYKAFGTAREALDKVIDSMEKQLQEPIQQKAGVGTINDAIRRHVNELPAKDRTKFLEAALDANDDAALTAILGAPHYLSGIGKMEHTYYLRKLHEQRNPLVVKRLELTRKVIVHLERAMPIALGQVEKAFRSTFANAKDIKDRAAGSQKAVNDVIAALAALGG
jgi:hypothetical protein